MSDYCKVLVEKTEGLYPHTYYLNKGGKLVAFKRDGESAPFFFSKPMSFSRTYRKFDDITKKVLPNA